MEKNIKYVIREVPPENSDFSAYFDNDRLKSVGGENCAVYIIPADRIRNSGFNMEEYEYIEKQAQDIIDGFNDVKDKWTNGYSSYANYKEVLEYNNVLYSPRKCHLLKKMGRTCRHKRHGNNSRISNHYHG